MQTLTINTINDEKLSSDRLSIDLEAIGISSHGLLPSPRFDLPSRSLINRLESSTSFQKLLRYPAPDSIDIKSTSWLDGVRGVAALGVYIFHAMGCWEKLVPAWQADENQNNILQMPIFRTVFVSGGAAVSLFFVISGYVLTYKSLRWMRRGAAHLVIPSVASSMFRRGFRLYLPPVLLTFCEMLSTRLGFLPPLNFTFIPETTFIAQFVDWLGETSRLINPIYNFKRAIQGFVSHPKYDAVVWTIPLEFYGSFVCYILLLILVRVPSNGMRMGLVGALSCISLLLGSWNTFCFLSGMLVADFNISKEESGTISSTMSASQGFIWTAISATAFYIAGFPTLAVDDANIKPMFGFETLRSLIPMFLNMEDHARFWWSLSGIALLLSISQLPRLKSVFETNFCQYLGKISFSLYLVHVFCVVLFGLSLQRFMMAIVGIQSHDGTLLYWITCVIWYFVFSVLVFAIAGQVEKWVDAPSVRFARWLEAKCLKRLKALS